MAGQPRAAPLEKLVNMTGQNTSVSSACCKIPPVDSAYQAVGSTVAVTNAGFDAYVVGPQDSKKAILIVYDIFGFHPCTKQTVDLLSKGLCARVYMPDLFLGKPWPLSDFPPADSKKLVEWMGTAGAWDKQKPRIETCLKFIRDQGIQDISLVGFCWGGKIAAKASDELAAQIKSVAIIHPAAIDVKDAENAKRPWCLLPSKDEGDMTAVEAELKKKDFAAQFVYQRFNDMHHGWCGARADFNQENNRKRTHEAITIMIQFFNNTM